MKSEQQQHEALLPTSLDENIDDNTAINTSASRWHMLSIFCGISFINSFCWISFAPIPDYTTTFYNVGFQEVNLLSMSFMICYLPGTLLSGDTLPFTPHPTCLGGLNRSTAPSRRRKAVSGDPTVTARPNLLLSHLDTSLHSATEFAARHTLTPLIPPSQVG